MLFLKIVNTALFITFSFEIVDIPINFQKYIFNALPLSVYFRSLSDSIRLLLPKLHLSHILSDSSIVGKNQRALSDGLLRPDFHIRHKRQFSRFPSCPSCSIQREEYVCPVRNG